MPSPVSLLSELSHNLVKRILNKFFKVNSKTNEKVFGNSNTMQPYTQEVVTITRVLHKMLNYFRAGQCFHK